MHITWRSFIVTINEKNRYYLQRKNWLKFLLWELIESCCSKFDSINIQTEIHIQYIKKSSAAIVFFIY